MAYRAFSRLAVKAARYCGHQGPRFPITGRFPSSTAPCFASFSTLTRHGSTGTDTGSTNRPRAVIFDVGGVVVPSPFPVFARFEREQGLSAGSVIHTIKETGGEGAWAKLERGEITVGEFGEPFSKEYESITGRAVPAEVFRKFLEGFRVGKQVTVAPLMVEVMEKLRSLGVKTAILTNNFRYDDGGTLRPQENLNVDVVIESCVEGSRKPEISIYQETLRRLEVEASETVFLDDIGSNLKTARDLGMATIKVEDLSDALGVLEELLKLGPLASGVRVTGTSEVDPKLVFPVEGLVAYLREKHSLEADEPPLIRQFRHGQSNPTYYIQYAGAQLVLRKKPPGKLLPSAHAVEREYRCVMSCDSHVTLDDVM
jgi:acyl-CoA dehydrogenase family protein 10